MQFLIASFVLSCLEIAAVSAGHHHHLSGIHACPSLPQSVLEYKAPNSHFGHHFALETNHTTIPFSAAPISNPWSYPPDCVSHENLTEPMCVFTSTTFAAGRGISLLTTPSAASEFLALPAFSNPSIIAEINARMASPPYEVRELPGRGKGLIAKKTIQRGDLIFAHTPVLAMNPTAFELDEKDRLALGRKAVSNLPEPTRELFMELHGHFGTADQVDDRINTNAFELEIGEVEHHGVFPETARLNHDCRPNAAYFFDEDTMTHYVHAITTIPPGDEVTITYIDALQSREERMSALKTSWGFTCSCSLCSAHHNLTAESDSRISQIIELNDVLHETAVKTIPQVPESLISLYEQERLHSWLSSAYVYAALAYSGVGDKWPAIRYARLAVEIGILDNGFRDEDVGEMKKLSTKPEEHWSWLKNANGTK